MPKSGVTSRQHVRRTRRYMFGVVGKKQGPACDEVVEQVVEVFFLPNTQLLEVGVFHSDLFAVCCSSSGAGNFLAMVHLGVW